MASLSSPSRTVRPKPIAALARSDAPALVVMMTMTLRKSTCLPLWSVSLPWSMIWSSTLKTSGCAFSISSSSSTTCGVLVHRIGQQPTLVEADIAGRRADQPRDAVALHIFRHVEPHQFDAEAARELAGGLRLADARRAREQVAADGFSGSRRPGPGELDRARQRLDGGVLAEHHRLQVALQRPATPRGRRG